MRRVDSIAELLGEAVPLAGRTVVDVGCGTGELVRWLAGRGAKVTGVDTPAMLARARAEPPAGQETYLQGGAEALPLPDQTVDVAIFDASLHHVPAERMRDAIAECARVLHPGGHAIFIEPVAEPGSYHDLTRLAGDETEVQRLAHAVLLEATAQGLQPETEELFYLSRSFADYEQLVTVFVEDEAHRADCLAQARRETGRRAVEAGVAFDDVRYRSICRLDVLRRS